MKKKFAILLVASVLLRLWVALGYWSDKPLTKDAEEYLELAKNYNESGSFQYDPHPTFQIESYGRAPGYPFWLALLLRIHPSLSWIRITEVLISILSCWVFFLVGRELFGPRAGVAALVIATFYIPFLSLIPPILSENVWILLMLLGYFFLVRVRTRGESMRSRNMACSVFFLAVATLIRPGAVFLLPFFALWIARVDRWPKAVAACALYFLILAPWNVYLYLQEGRFVFVASEGGVTFWTGTHPQHSGDGDLAVNPPVQKDYRQILRANAGLTPTQKEKLFFRDGVGNALRNPLAYAFLEARKVVFAFLPFGASVWKTSLVHRVTGILSYLPILVLALLVYRRAPADARWFGLGIAASYLVMILLFFPQERFRIAMLDPVLVLFAAYGYVKT